MALKSSGNLVFAQGLGTSNEVQPKGSWFAKIRNGLESKRMTPLLVSKESALKGADSDADVSGNDEKGHSLLPVRPKLQQRPANSLSEKYFNSSAISNPSQGSQPMSDNLSSMPVSSSSYLTILGRCFDLLTQEAARQLQEHQNKGGDKKKSKSTISSAGDSSSGSKLFAGLSFSSNDSDNTANNARSIVLLPEQTVPHKKEEPLTQSQTHTTGNNSVVVPADVPATMFGNMQRDDTGLPVTITNNPAYSMPKN
jgi:hypothetical protein